MIGFSETNFLREYIKPKKDKKTGLVKNKLEDNFQTGKQKLLPFTLNPVSGSVYDGTCVLNGVAGEFYRIKTQSTIDPIYTAADTEETLRKELNNKFKMPADDIERFIKVFNDVMFENETLNVIDLSFFSFVPMKYFGKAYEKDKRVNKYKSGQPKIADYYASIAENIGVDFETKEKNLFCEVVNECLQKDSFGGRRERDKYFILPFVKQQFSEDIKWLLKQNNNVIVKYLPLMLYFYASYSIMQTLLFLNKANWQYSIDKPRPVTYMLSSERASEGQAAVKRGWAASDHFPETFLNKISAYAQALDILNSMFEDEEELMTFHEILERFGKMEFDDDAKEICEKVLNTYQDFKYELLDDRDTEPHPIAGKVEVNINSFKEFVTLLLDRCQTYQSVDYPRMKVALYSLVNIKLFEKRRDYSVLVFDEEMLLFLVAMLAKNERIRMEDLFKRFREYGVEFSFQTKNAIGDYLLKLNLLERKSDSGEAQYVRVVL